MASLVRTSGMCSIALLIVIRDINNSSQGMQAGIRAAACRPPGVECWRPQLPRLWQRPARMPARAALAMSHLGVHPALTALGSSLSLLDEYLAGHARAQPAAAARKDGGPLAGAEHAQGDDISVPAAAARVWGMLSGQCERALARFRP